MKKAFFHSFFIALAIASGLNFSSCDEEFNEFEFANDIIVSGNLMFDGDSAIANQRVVLILDYARNPVLSPEFLDQTTLSEDTTDVNGFFSFSYKTNNKVVGADTCDAAFAEGIRMIYGNNTAFSCFPSNRNFSELELYTSNEMTLSLTIQLGMVDSDTVFFNYAPSDTLHPNYIERVDAEGRRHILFYALSSPNKTIITSYSTELKNGRYEGFSGQRRTFEPIQYGIGFDSYLTAQRQKWRPEGKPFTDQLEISIN